jgi:hypothetical protein
VHRECLLAQGLHLRLARGSRSEQIEQRPGDQADEVAHPAFIARFGASRQADGIPDRDRHLRHVLRAYQQYYNGTRTHLALAKDSPLTRSVQTIGRILPLPILGGLHHRYVRI